MELGEELYLLNTRNGQQVISVELASMMTVAELKAVLLYSYERDIDFEADIVATESIRNCCMALAEKETGRG